MNNNREWIPGLSVGGISFGLNETDLVEKLGFKLVALAPEGDPEGWTVYGKGDNFNVCCEEGKVVCITCYDHLIIKGKDIIGRSLPEIAKFLNYQNFVEGEPMELHPGIEIPVEFEGLGLQLWVDEQGIAKNASLDDASL